MSQIIEWLDWPLAWLLDLPRDWTLIILSFASAAIMITIRRIVTDQSLLRRCRDDLITLRRRIRQVRQQGDRPTIEGLRNILALIKMIQLRADLRVLAWSILPIGLLAAWTAARVDYLPVRSGQLITVRAEHPLSSVGKPAHLVPNSDFTIETSTIVLPTDDGQSAQAYSEWQIRPVLQSGQITLTIRHQAETVVHPLWVGRIVGAVELNHQAQRIPRTRIDLPRFRFLGIVPGIERIGFPPWLVAYVLLTVPFAALLKRVARVY